MALIHCNFFSESLRMATAMDVVLPQRGEGPRQAPGRRADGSGIPCLWLLHGLSDDHTIWQRRTAIERYAGPLGLAVVMPNVHRSFYADMQQGGRYWSFLADELPDILHDLLGLKPRPSEQYVAGLSMGGYGAFKLALRLPERFAAAASLSGALDMQRRITQPDPATGRPDPEWQAVFGSGPISGTDNDLFTLAASHPTTRPLPRLYQWCGREDFLYQDNLRFRDAMRERGLPLTYEEGPGDHTWACWDRGIERVLDWMLANSGQTAGGTT